MFITRDKRAMAGDSFTPRRVVLKATNEPHFAS
jgi:hypothetical protein